jgi:hypothetical protein
MTQREIDILSRQALRAFQEAVRSAKKLHAKENRPFYVMKDGRVVNYFSSVPRSPKRKAHSIPSKLSRRD